jgi:hypothetical protein
MGAGLMPTRRIFVMTCSVIALSRPVMGSMRLWAIKTMGATSPGTAMHTAAEVVAILT